MCLLGLPRKSAKRPMQDVLTVLVVYAAQRDLSASSGGEVPRQPYRQELDTGR